MSMSSTQASEAKSASGLGLGKYPCNILSMVAYSDQAARKIALGKRSSSYMGFPLPEGSLTRDTHPKHAIAEKRFKPE